jgi:hypothetical protein
MRYSYAGYYQIRRYGLIDTYPLTIADRDNFNTEVNNPTPTESEERTRVMDIAMDVSQEFERYMEQTFMPYVETHYFAAKDNDQIMQYSNQLRLDAPLMELTSVTLGNNVQPTVGTDVVGSPRQVTPITKLQLLGFTNYWNQYSTQWRQAIEIAAIWGYRSRFATEGFIDSGDTIQNDPNISATATEITVADATAANALNVVPRFDVGQLIRVTTDSTDEYMVITDIDYATDKLTVLRGQRGTDAAVHLKGLKIYVFQPEPDIVQACAKAVDFEYSNIGKYETVQVSNIPGAKQTTIQPELWPASVMRTLNYYRKITIGSAGGAGIYSYG